MVKIFLSAGIPMPGRDPRFEATIDKLALRDALKALISILDDDSQIVFGGQPAITALLVQLLYERKDNLNSKFKLYQSRFFESHFTQFNSHFSNIVITEKISEELEDNLAHMRNRMIGEEIYDVGVFLGGMEGILKEFNLFKDRHPNAVLCPVGTTGAAATEILLENVEIPHHELLSSELTFLTLFRTTIFSKPNNSAT